MAELPDATYARIKRLCKQGDIAVEGRHYSLALRLYRDALNLIPEPRTDWNASTWILTAIGDAHLFHGEFNEARDALQQAMQCPGAIGNPYVHLRLGQAQYELGDLDRAADELTRAYMGGGPEIFKSQASKYFDFVKSRIVS